LSSRPERRYFIKVDTDEIFFAKRINAQINCPSTGIVLVVALGSRGVHVRYLAQQLFRNSFVILFFVLRELLS
jgi:hypothetical protein